MSKKLWGWKIIKDNVSTPDEGEYYKTGKEYRDYQGGQHRYRLKDDDGEVYYYFLSDIDANEGTETQVFAPLDWGENMAGCTTLEWKNPKTGKYEVV